MRLSCHTVAAIDVSSMVTLAQPCANLLVKNDGGSTVYVNITTGIAATSGTGNAPIFAGESVTFWSEARDILYVGLICASGQTASVRLLGSVPE